MKNTINRESYFLTKTIQLKQWKRVLDKLISRAEKTKDRKKTELLHHIVKIQVKKARTEAKLRQLQNEKNGNRSNLKADFEKSWGDLRKAFLRASAKTE